MLTSVFGKSLRDSWRTVVAWGLAQALMGLFLVNTFASISLEDRAIAGQMISSAKALVGDIEAAGTIGGMLNWKFFVFFPLLMAIFTILQGTAAVAGEEERRTLDIILSCPLPRWRLVLEKFGALTVSTLGISFLTTLGFWAANALFAAELGYGRILLAVLNGTLLALAAGAFALFLTGLVPGRRTAGLVTGVLLMASYMLNTLATVSEALRPYQPLSVFYHYSQSQPLTSTMAWANAALLVALTAVFLAGAIVSFQWRDLGVGSPIAHLLPRLAARPYRKRHPWTPARFSLLHSVGGKALRDARWAVAAWGGSLGLLAVFFLAFYPLFQQFPDIERIWADMPAVTRALIGEFTSLMTLPGFLTVGFLAYLPLVLTIFAITEAMEAVAEEDERRTADLLLCVPLPRWRVLAEKILASVVGLVAVAIITFVGLVVGVAITGIAWNWWHLLGAALNAVPPAAAIGAFALFVSSLTRGRSLAVGLATGLTVFSYFLNTLAPFAAWLKPLQPWSVFYHYSNSQPLTANFAWGSIGFLVAVAMLFFAGALVAFERRDIGT